MERKNYVTWVGSFIISWFLPVFCFAEFWITEIHYNPPGSDSGFEWIEVQNRGSGTESIEKFIFRENETNHGLKIFQGDFVLNANEYIVIADKPEKFITVFSDYQGTIIDSAFSLNNTGEKLELLDPNKNIVFDVTYSSDTAAGDDGSSIGLLDNDIWQAVIASPGSGNSAFILETELVEESRDNTETTTTEPVVVTEPQPNNFNPDAYVQLKDPDYRQKLITVQSGGDRTVMAGADYQFSGQVFGLTGEPLDEPEVHWNWGDGSTSEGTATLHTYQYPGTYTAVMRGQLRDYSARDYFTVTVITPSITISNAVLKNNTVTLRNDSPYVLELSGYQLLVDEQNVTLPADTFIASQGSITLSGDINGFTIQPQSVVSFRYPRGTTLSDYNVRFETAQNMQNELHDLQTQALALQQAPEADSLEDKESDTSTTESIGVTRAIVYTNIAAVPENGEELLTESVATAIAPITQPNQVIRPEQSANISGSFSSQNSPYFTLQIILIIIILGITALIGYLQQQRNKKELTEAEEEASKINIL